MKLYGVSISVIALLIIMSCSKDKSYDSLEINYQAKTSINDNNVIHDKIEYKYILGYDSLNYYFEIDSNAIKKMKKYFFPSGGLPFSVRVNGETIYSGKFFPAYSNSLPCGIIIDPYADGNNLYVTIDSAYCNNVQLLDLRNDNRIIKVLQKDNKLILLHW